MRAVSSKPQTLCGFIQQRHHLARVPEQAIGLLKTKKGARFINIGKACSHTGKGTNPTGEGLLQILCFNIVLMSEAELTPPPDSAPAAIANLLY